MDSLHVKNIEEYQPTYKDGRNLLWIRWEIGSLGNYKLSKLNPSQRYLFISLLCLETKHKKELPVDYKWLSGELKYPKSCIAKDLLMLQTFELIIITCESPSPTLRNNTVQNITNNTVQNRVFPFEEVWKNYPNKDGKQSAERHFIGSVKTDQDWIDINSALKNYLSSERVKKGFIKNGSTWFNGWRDWVNFKDTPPVVQDKPKETRQIIPGYDQTKEYLQSIK